MSYFNFSFQEIYTEVPLLPVIRSTIIRRPTSGQTHCTRLVSFEKIAFIHDLQYLKYRESPNVISMVQSNLITLPKL
jgi:hypothetical protein